MSKVYQVLLRDSDETSDTLGTYSTLPKASLGYYRCMKKYAQHSIQLYEWDIDAEVENGRPVDPIPKEAIIEL